MKRLLGIAAVWVGCAFAWVVLGSTLMVRSGESSSSMSPEVHQLWGPPLEQAQPTAAYADTRTVRSTRTTTGDDGHTSVETNEREEAITVPVPLVASDLTVHLSLEHRRRGLVWFPTYQVDFTGRYSFENTDATARDVTFSFPLQADNAVYDGFSVQDGEGNVVASSIESEPHEPDHSSRTREYGSSATRAYAPAVSGSAHWRARVEPGQRVVFAVAYRTRGTETWRYRMAHGTTRVSDFNLAMTTDFEDVDFPAGTLSPTEHGVSGRGWHGTWAFDSLIANQPIGVEPPTRMNPGPLAARITFFAPVGLLFFFFVVAVLAVAREKDLHPMHYFFLGCSFFAFHLMFGYLVDHFSITASFATSAAVSLLLVVTYARLFVGWRFALREIGIAQLLYLVLFSSTFLFEGFTGLAITVGAVLTLFVMMQITGRTSWNRSKPSSAPASSRPTSGYPTSGHATTGHASTGHATSGHATSGHATSNHPPPDDGAPDDGASSVPRKF